VSLVGLTVAQYAALLGGAGALVVLFYILKLRRRRVAVPFGKLWERVLMERQATSLIHRLKRILSLLVQLLLLWLLATAIADPRADEELRRGRDFVVLVDASASMRARDVARGDGRIGQARAEVRRMIERLGPRDRMMIVQMDARVLPLTAMVGERLVLEEGLAKVHATDTRADYARALRLARDVLTEGRESHVVLVSDGVLDEPRDELGEVDLGGAALHWIKVGRGGRNVGVTGFSVRRYPIDRSSCEIFVEVANTGDREELVELTLAGDGHDLLVRRLPVGAGARARLTLPSQQAASRSLEARVDLVGGRCQTDRDCAAAPATDAASSRTPSPRTTGPSPCCRSDARSGS
jgi:Ca-activated chloride channel family protein